MPAGNASQDDAENFPIPLAGHVVNCTSLSDAVAVKTAEDILSGADPTPYLPAALQRIADILVRYHRADAAQRLAARHTLQIERKSR
jgi:hypothetical protein